MEFYFFPPLISHNYAPYAPIASVNMYGYVIPSLPSYVPIAPSTSYYQQSLYQPQGQQQSLSGQQQHLPQPDQQQQHQQQHPQPNYIIPNINDKPGFVPINSGAFEAAIDSVKKQDEMRKEEEEMYRYQRNLQICRMRNIQHPRPTHLIHNINTVNTNSENTND